MSSASLPPSNGRNNRFIIDAVMVLAALILYMVMSPLCAFLLSAVLFTVGFIVSDDDDE